MKEKMRCRACRREFERSGSNTFKVTVDYIIWLCPLCGEKQTEDFRREGKRER